MCNKVFNIANRPTPLPSRGSAFFLDNNQLWRSVFTFEPDVLFELWTPFLMGAISMFIQFDNESFERISGSWSSMFWWYLSMAVFGSFGFANNFGVITGFFLSLVTLMCLVTYFIAPLDAE
eukprot:1012339_1